MKIRKIIIRILFVLLAVVAAVLVVRAVLNFTEGRRLARTVADLKEKGIPISSKDLAPPCPDEDNAARLWKAAEALLIIEREEQKILSQAFNALVTGKALDSPHREALVAMIAKNELALRLVREMGEKQCFLYRADRSVALVDSLIPGAVKMISAFRLIGFEALLKAESGDVPGAVEELRAALKSPPKLAGEGLLLTYLLACAETRMLFNFLAGVSVGRALDETTLVSLIDELDPSAWRSLLARSISGERVLSLEWGSALIRGNTKALIADNCFDRFFYWLARPILKAEIVWRLRRYDDWEKIVDNPYYKQRESLGKGAERPDDEPWYFKLTGFQDGGAYSTVFLKEAMLEATLLASRTGLACKLYKIQSGEYPENLGALVPGILKDVPIDPFTGKPLVYRREGKGFIVYSLGSNEKDDGGRSTYMITRLVMDKDDDWSWRELW
jgi:hypothetical protein